jgi:general secretion pathway protein A
MSNLNSRATMLQLVLVGQPEFRETLKRKDLRQLNQRVATFYSLEPFTLAETAGYIDHRMKVAGGQSGTFTAGAVKLIWRESEGIPRRINTLCDLALVYGFSSGQETINAPLAAEMLAERREMAVQTAADVQDEPHWDEESEQDELCGLGEHADDASRASLKVVGHSPRHPRE